MFISISSKFIFTILISFLNYSNSLKCKCTQSSPKVPCQHGVCEVPTKISSCLMLDHPKSGLHYACSTNANLGEGECVEKKSKTGANVKVCSCYSSDFCNFKIWPDGRQELEEQNSKSEEEEDDNDDENEKEYGEENKKEEILNTNNSKNLKYSFLIIFILNLFFYFNFN
uniref:SWIM-type domain-containing protein n=1 Tax=Meloidogyne incognita TaxID=6306 RepID=A0A914M738_MELIC